MFLPNNRKDGVSLRKRGLGISEVFHALIFFADSNRMWRLSTGEWVGERERINLWWEENWRVGVGGGSAVNCVKWDLSPLETTLHTPSSEPGKGHEEEQEVDEDEEEDEEGMGRRGQLMRWGEEAKRGDGHGGQRVDKWSANVEIKNEAVKSWRDKHLSCLLFIHLPTLQCSSARGCLRKSLNNACHRIFRKYISPLWQIYFTMLTKIFHLPDK